MKQVRSRELNLTITLLTPEYMDPVVTLLVKNGWGILPLFEKSGYCTTRNTCAVFGAKVQIPSEQWNDANLTDIAEHIHAELTAAKIMFHSLALTSRTPECVFAGNIDLSKDKGPYR